MPPISTIPRRQPDPREKEALAVNQVGYERVKADLPSRYPHLQWVAFSSGEIVADGKNLAALLNDLEVMGLNPRLCMVARVGEAWPDNPTILSADFYGIRG